MRPRWWPWREDDVERHLTEVLPLWALALTLFTVLVFAVVWQDGRP